MTHTNLQMPIRMEAADRLAMKQAHSELEFWRKEAERLAAGLENIPRAVKRYGFIEVPDGSESIRLVVQPADAEPEEA